MNKINQLLTSGTPRSILLKKNILSIFFIKGFSILISLLFVPLTINYISSEKYGIWLTVTSIVSWFSLLNIGFADGMRNRLAEAKATGDITKAASYISTTYFYLFIVFSLLALIVNLIGTFDLAGLLKVSSSMNDELVTVFKIVISFFCLQISFSTITYILTANQEPAKGALIDMIGQALALGLVYILTKIADASLVDLAICISCAPVIVMIISSIYIFKYKYPQFKPSLKLVDKSFAKEILSLGLKFFVINIAVVLLYQTTNIIISRVAGPVNVTIYNISYRYLSVVTMLFNIIITPIWSAFTDAYTKNDYNWMNNVYSKLLKTFYVFVLFLLVVLIVSPFFYKIWVGDSVKIPFAFTAFLSLYMMTILWNSIHSPIINGIGKIKLQLYLSLFGSVLNVPLSLYLGSIWGIYGVVASIFLFNMIPVIFLRIQVKKILNKKAIGIWNK